MKIGFFTKSINAPASDFYWNALKTIENISHISEYSQIKMFDIVLVMTYDHHIIENIKNDFENIIVGIIDPRSYKVEKSVEKSDFIVIDSIEMEDFWTKSKKPIFRYIEYPNIRNIKKVHSKKNKIKIGYHGNTVHIKSIYKSLKPALESLGKKYNLELVVIYNGPVPSIKENWIPENVKVSFARWTKNIYHEVLSDCDIGVVPNRMYFDEPKENNSQFNFSKDDYILRFKMPSNPGRIIIFGKLGIPVVSDMYPSGIEILSDERGYVCHSKSGWEDKIEKLIINEELRNKISLKLQSYINKNYDFNLQNKKFLDFLSNTFN